MSKEIVPVEQLVEDYSDILNHEDYPVLSAEKKKVLARLLHNENTDYLRELTQTGDVEKYEPILVPVIRRGYPQLIGMDIFGVQPMSSPTSLIFAMKSGYHNDSNHPVKQTSSIVLNLVDGSGYGAGDVITSDGSGSGIGTVRYVEGNLVLVEVTSGTWAVGDSVDDANPYASEVTTVANVWTNETQFSFLFKNYDKFSTVALAEAANTNIREVGFEIDKNSVTAVSHKLKAKFTDELVQDLQAVHGMSAESEISRIVSSEMVAEQNWTFINELYTQAVLGGNNTFTWGTHTDGRWEMEKVINTYSYMNKVGNNIVKTTMRGVGNFIVASPDVASKFESMDIFTPAQNFGVGKQNFGSSVFLGTLGHKYNLYVDLYNVASEDYAVVGYKGTSEWDAGIYYAPYIPLTVKKGMGEEDGQPRMFFGTRYGLAHNPLGASNYYRYIKVTL